MVAIITPCERLLGALSCRSTLPLCSTRETYSETSLVQIAGQNQSQLSPATLGQFGLESR